MKRTPNKKYTIDIFNLILSIIFAISSVFPVQAQEQNFEIYDSIVNMIDVQIGNENLPIFNGIRFYDLFNSNNENFRYLETYKPFRASIIYNNLLYQDILTRYDLLNDHLVVYTEGEFSFFQVQLANEKIDSFQLGEYSFAKIDLSGKYNKNANSFYEIAYSGQKINLFVDWSKTEKLNRSSQRPFYSFKTFQEYYIKLNKAYFIINKRKDVTQLFPENRDGINKFYQAYKNLDKNNPREFMVKLANYLDQNLKN